MNFLIANENVIRLASFVAVLVLMLALETLFPKKRRVQSRKTRWLTNIGLIIVDTVLLRLALPIVAVGTAVFATENNWGLFNLLSWPPWIEFILAIVLLDMMIYWQHVAAHHVPLLWRIHKVHHSDRDIDLSTGIRFHPIEIILSMLYKMVCVVILGPAIAAVLLFEIILNACAVFNHANVSLPAWLDRNLRALIVTPDMHRVHHSIKEQETNSNYGFSLSIWDRLFGSYIDQPELGHADMTIGLSEYQNDKPSKLIWVLALPFKATKKTAVSS